MPINIGAHTAQRSYAGLAIYDNALYFAELDENYETIRTEKVDLPEGCMQGDSVKDLRSLEIGFTNLRARVGRLHEPVMIGLPQGDTIIRILNLPKMSIDDVRGTLDLNFEEYFPYPRPEAVFDVIAVTTPADLADRDEMTVMAVSAKRDLVEDVLNIARKTGLPAGAVEPLHFSMLRAIPEGKEGLSVFADPRSVIVIYDGGGIFFRTANNLSGPQDLQNTMQFTAITYRRVQMKNLILADLNFQINADSGLNVVNITNEFFGAEGLAMRDDPSAARLDLRPSKYVELERRRYSFNPNRLILWGLLVAFVMLSMGTISFTWMQIDKLNEELEVLRANNSGLMQRRAEIAAANSRLESHRKQTEQIMDFLRSDIPVLEVLNALEANTATGIKFDDADFSRGLTGIITVVIDGKAEDQKSVVTMTEGLKASGVFSEVRLPFSQKDQIGRTLFKLVLIVKGIA